MIKYKCGSIKEKIKEIGKMILGLPLFGLEGIMLFFIKLTSEKLPFLSELKETWSINFFPSWYEYLIK